MKNKVKNILILFVIVTMFFIIGVKANAELANSNIPETYEIKSEDIPTSTYVIGTHMFTREKNEEIGYDGQLSTQLIMFASQTINSDNINDMIIYYKNPRGRWVNALTEDLVDEPSTFEISKKDLVKYVPTPILMRNTYIETPLNQEYNAYVSVKNYEDYYSESSEYIYNISGIELYKTWVGGDGKRRYQITDALTKPDSFFKELRMIGGNSDRYVARAYVLDENGNKIYSEYSNEIDFYYSFISYEKGRLSLDEFQTIDNQKTLGELKENYNLEPSISNLDDNAKVYLYDFKGVVNNGISYLTPNVQFKFASNDDNAKVIAKVYSPGAFAEEIAHSQYDDGDGEIEASDFYSIKLLTQEELLTLLGQPYMIEVIYEHSVSDEFTYSDYPVTKYTYNIKDSNKVLNFIFDNSEAHMFISNNILLQYSENYNNATYISEDSKYELKINSINETFIGFDLYSENGHTIQFNGEPQVTTVLNPVYKIIGDYYWGGPVILGNLRFIDNGIVIDSYVYKDNDTLDGKISAVDDLKIGYSQIKFNLTEE